MELHVVKTLAAGRQVRSVPDLYKGKRRRVDTTPMMDDKVTRTKKEASNALRWQKARQCIGL
jgi:hypothetical protein